LLSRTDHCGCVFAVKGGTSARSSRLAAPDSHAFWPRAEATKVHQRRATYSVFESPAGQGLFRMRASHSLGADATATSGRCRRRTTLAPSSGLCSFMQPPHLGMGLPGISALVQKINWPASCCSTYPDVQFLDTFTGFHLLLKFNTCPSPPGTYPVCPNEGRQRRLFHTHNSRNTTSPASFWIRFCLNHFALYNTSPFRFVLLLKPAT
jgi:hypothetical protein